MAKKLTIKSKDMLPVEGGIMLEFEMSGIIPKTQRGEKLDRERKLLIIDDQDNPQNKPS